jgi:hypothetical protein
MFVRQTPHHLVPLSALPDQSLRVVSITPAPSQQTPVKVASFSTGSDQDDNDASPHGHAGRLSLFSRTCICSATRDVQPVTGSYSKCKNSRPKKASDEVFVGKLDILNLDVLSYPMVAKRPIVDYTWFIVRCDKHLSKCDLSQGICSDYRVVL